MIFSVAGLENLVVKTEDDYIDKAVELASDVPSLATLRSGLREKMLNSYLCDGPNFVKGLEEKYRQLWHRYCDGDIPSETRKKAQIEVLGDAAADMPMKEVPTAAAAPNLANQTTAPSVTPRPSPTSTLSPAEGNGLGEPRRKRSPSPLGQPS